MITEEKQKDFEHVDLIKKQVAFLHSDITFKNITPKQYVESMMRIEDQIKELEDKYGVKPERPRTVSDILQDIHESFQRMGKILDAMLKAYEPPEEDIFEESEYDALVHDSIEEVWEKTR